MRLLGDGRELGLRSVTYAYQEGEGGIADALRLAGRFAQGDRVVVVLGDNIMEKSIRSFVENYARQSSGAKILLKEVEDPQRFGVAELEGDRVMSIEEKPEHPKTNLAVIGVYMYDRMVFDIIEGLEPSARGELEITDVNNAYIERGELSYGVLDGWWTDAGTFDSLRRACDLVRSGGANKA